MKIRRKTNKCLNCFRNIDEIYNFCPNCGQENTNRNVSFKDLIREFFNNYLSFDSKFGRSIVPFFLKPGKLTNEFISGRRVNYANPIRLYLVLSLFFFFILSQFNSNKNKDSDGLINSSFGNASQIEVDSLNFLSENPDLLFKEIESEGDTIDSKFKNNLGIFLKLKSNKNVSDVQIYDSLNLKEYSKFEKLFVKQTIRVSRANSTEMMSYIIEHIPLLMFILLPLFALLLKLLYVRRNKFYIIHLVHSLHMHSFMFLILGIATGVSIFVEDDIGIKLIVGSLILALFYIILSFRNVYQQGILKTLLKFCFFGFIYMIMFSFGLLLEMFISLAFY